MKTVFALAALVLGAAGLSAQESYPFQASLVPDIAIYPRTTEIRGVSLNIWGENPQQGFTLGLVNGSTADSSGFTFGLVNYAESYTGVSWGLCNYSSTSFVGWQGGLLYLPAFVNISEGAFTGFQCAWALNYAEEFHGLQLGFVNYAKELHGVQIGLVNFARNNTWFQELPDNLAICFPIVNWSF